jgi:hypothetical protein
VEKKIDSEFEKSALIAPNFSQAVWTFLSVVEDYNLKIHYIDKLPVEQLHINTDVMINALAHPVRGLYSKRRQASISVIKELINDHYSWASDWLDQARKYDALCNIFPLYHRKKSHYQLMVMLSARMIGRIKK